MRWGSEVALGFVAAEAVALLYLALRNRCFDRVNAISHFPLVGQQLLQAALWPHIGGDGQACSAANRALSLAVGAVVTAVPLYTAALAKASQAALLLFHDVAAGERLRRGRCPGGHALASFDTYDPRFYCSVCGRDEMPLRSAMWGCRDCDFDACAPCVEAAEVRQEGAAMPIWASLLLGPQPCLWAPLVPERLRLCTRRQVSAAACYWVLACWYMQRRTYGEQGDEDGGIVASTRCTQRGPNGHQVWPMLVWGQYAWVRLALVVLYFFLLGSGPSLVPKPSYTPMALNCLAAAAAALCLGLGDEWASVWCWLASCLCAMHLAEPCLLQHFRVFDPEVLAAVPSADPRRRRLGFWAARMHWLPEALPWAGARGKPPVPATSL